MMVPKKVPGNARYNSYPSLSLLISVQFAHQCELKLKLLLLQLFRCLTSSFIYIDNQLSYPALPGSTLSINYFSLCLSVYLSVFLCFFLSIHMSIVTMSICLYVYLCLSMWVAIIMPKIKNNNGAVNENQEQRRQLKLTDLLIFFAEIMKNCYQL